LFSRHRFLFWEDYIFPRLTDPTLAGTYLSSRGLLLLLLSCSQKEKFLIPEITRKAEMLVLCWSSSDCDRLVLSSWSTCMQVIVTNRPITTLRCQLARHAPVAVSWLYQAFCLEDVNTGWSASEACTNMIPDAALRLVRVWVEGSASHGRTGLMFLVSAHEINAGISSSPSAPTLDFPHSHYSLACFRWRIPNLWPPGVPKGFGGSALSACSYVCCWQVLLLPAAQTKPISFATPRRQFFSRSCHRSVIAFQAWIDWSAKAWIFDEQSICWISNSVWSSALRTKFMSGKPKLSFNKFPRVRRRKGLSYAALRKGRVAPTSDVQLLRSCTCSADNLPQAWLEAVSWFGVARLQKHSTSTCRHHPNCMMQARWSGPLARTLCSIIIAFNCFHCCNDKPFLEAFAVIYEALRVQPCQ